MLCRCVMPAMCVDVMRCRCDVDATMTLRCDVDEKEPGDFGRCAGHAMRCDSMRYHCAPRCWTDVLSMRCDAMSICRCMAMAGDAMQSDAPASAISCDVDEVRKRCDVRYVSMDPSIGGPMHVIDFPYLSKNSFGLLNPD